MELSVSALLRWFPHRVTRTAFSTANWQECAAALDPDCFKSRIEGLFCGLSSESRGNPLMDSSAGGLLTLTSVRTPELHSLSAFDVF